MSSSAKKEKKRLKNKTILVGVTGGVAAYKSVELVRRLGDSGASVHVVMTDASQRFITPLSLEVASGNPVHTSLFQEPLTHIRLPSVADLIVVAPATANFISKFSHGIADDLLTTCMLSYRGAVLVAPSMNWRMYENTVIQQNLNQLRSLGVKQVGPASGSLACGEEGPGRMAEVNEILDAVEDALTAKDLAGESIVVTAGPTREHIDPIRYISNRSSGKMGYALARRARLRGARVILISGPSSLVQPYGVHFERVETAEEMLKAVLRCTGEATVLIMAAAVADFRARDFNESKIEKNELPALSLYPTTDIITEVSRLERKPFIIGFAAETGPDISRAVKKLQQKNMNLVVFNDVTGEGAGFDVDTNRVVIHDGEDFTECGLLSKEDVADAVLDKYVQVRTRDEGLTLSL